MTGSILNLTGSNVLLGRTPALGTLTVNGNLTDSQVRAVGNIGNVTVGGASGSDVFSGVSPGTTALPVAADFTADSSILSFSTKGKNPFADSFVAASSIGKVMIDNATTNNGGVPFGVATKTLQTFSLLQPGQKPFTWNSHDPASLLATLPQDIKVELV